MGPDLPAGLVQHLSRGGPAGAHELRRHPDGGLQPEVPGKGREFAVAVTEDDTVGHGCRRTFWTWAPSWRGGLTGMTPARPMRISRRRPEQGRRVRVAEALRP